MYNPNERFLDGLQRATVCAIGAMVTAAAIMALPVYHSVAELDRVNDTSLMVANPNEAAYPVAN